MAKSEAATLTAQTREPHGTSEARRLRREGAVPGVVYGGESDAVAIVVDARELRHALAAGGQLITLAVDGSDTPVVLKEHQRHPVRGESIHVDFQRVRLDRAIQATVLVELVNSDDAPGIVEGGILQQVVSELNVEGLPGDMPDHVQIDVSAMQLNETLPLSAVPATPGITYLDDLDETIVATITPPSVEQEPEEEIETETELVGEGGEVAEAPAEGETGEQAEQPASGSDEG
ncbi:MAG TPA: 50S ribosomal protein L25 [Solirubrobacteraceae bacterium]|nr:50S ribosomal protein L25 [Solirubrobacteraceae bacterium]